MITRKRPPNHGRVIGTTSAIAILAGLFPASAVYGQAVSASPAPSAVPADEIVVTAERRSSTVQSTPLSITAVSGAELQARGITNVSQLASEIPGVSQRNGGPGQTEYEMRGVSSSGGTSPTVGFYLDDASLSPPVSVTQGKNVLDPNLYDINRIEVLRGPQGTLYGSSSMGGTIRLITNQPDAQDFGASLKLTGSGTSGGGTNGTASAMVNVPLVKDKLALRVVGTDSYTSGWIDRIVLDDFPLPTNNGTARGDVLSATPSATDRNSNWVHSRGARASLLWEPIADLTIAPTALYQKINQGGPNYIDQPPGAKYEAHYQPYNIAEPYSDEFKLFTLPIKYRLGGVQFDAITAYYHRVSSLIQDNSEYGQDFLEADFGIPASFAEAGPLSAFEHDRSSQFSQEIRLSSTGEGPFQWLAGFYYQHFKTNASAATSPMNAFTTDAIEAIVGADGLPLGSNPYFTIAQKTSLKQYAGFGEASYKLGGFKLTAGARYFSYKYVNDIIEGGSLVGPEFAESLPAQAHGINPRVNLSYIPHSDLTLYLQAAKGFRPGAGIPPAPVTCPSTPSQYSPDTVWTYEAGEKARLLSRRLTINSAAYFTDWTRIQQKIGLACGYSYTGNAGTAHVYGGEVEAALKVTPNFVVTNGLGYTHATLASVPAGSDFFVGQRVQGVPKWTNTTSVIYTYPLDEDHNLIFRATNEYVGNQQDITHGVANALRTVPSRDIVNLRLGLSNKQGASVSLFADNVTNKKTILEDSEQIFIYVPSINRAVANQPRTIGVELRYAFGGR